MTKPEMIEAIRKAAIEANPEIVELKFGCEVYCEQGIEDDKGNYHDEYSIVTGDIQLADVLMALNEEVKAFQKSSHTQTVHQWTVAVDVQGFFHKITSQGTDFYDKRWDLTKPLTLQCEETIRFIFNFLKNE